MADAAVGLRRAVCLALLALAAGCAPDEKAGEVVTGSWGGYATVVHVRGCDYVAARSGYGIAIVHAGDCQNHGTVRVTIPLADTTTYWPWPGAVLCSTSRSRSRP